MDAIILSFLDNSSKVTTEVIIITRCKSRICVLLALVVILVTSACNINSGSNVTASPSPPPATASVTGSVAYPTKGAALRAVSSDAIGLPTDLVLEVYLVSISRAGTPSAIISRQVIKGIANGPQPFTVEYLQEDIDESQRYAIQGRLMHKDELIATNFTVYRVLTYGTADHVNLVLESVGQKQLGWSDTPAPVESVSVHETYTGYSIQVISYIPNGCFRFKESEMKERRGRLRDIWELDTKELSANELLDTIAEAGFKQDINITVTNQEYTFPITCPIGVSFVETEIPLRVRELISGKTYTVFVNGELATTFTAR